MLCQKFKDLASFFSHFQLLLIDMLLYHLLDVMIKLEESVCMNLLCSAKVISLTKQMKKYQPHGCEFIVSETWMLLSLPAKMNGAGL